MYCRTCGNKMNDNAELCVKCGVRKNVGTEYCQVCGTRTTAEMAVCNKCGAKLLNVMSTTQIKKKVVSTGKRTLGTAFLVFGIFMFFSACVNTFECFTTSDFYASMGSISRAGTCSAIGALFLVLGIRFRKKK